MKILILCTGNSCRSQMAEGILRNMHPEAEIISAGTRPEQLVNPYAVKAMAEIGIDIGNHFPKRVEQFITEYFDYVITVCDNAKESCPVFTGPVKNRLHIGFEDPADAIGTDEEKMIVYRKIRDEIQLRFEKFSI
ncbi:MAG: protein tyrosine phosphatase [Bacteroidetes bacterium GWF2_43_63]|nr:MAG: protein tyrosine phosphatase [Bacteroidetes bacterium GWE2_42_42]OFY55781.1 MAG: protein tyrosine phosphatase [Bacteroidetes bacterium GWF2_43_63]HBG71302.1 protein tyrosine phosphatase [Bacteroidales bacterium]HCB60477.1 protein tyrosine phosphatase [Bacteroidales bacterium]HCY22566.1 protein tyrosine phosphatase [Bacteroidales bacterium]